MNGATLDLASVYTEHRVALTDVVRGLDGAQLGLEVPATPEWRVRDSIAHVSGVVADLLAGNLAGVGTQAWTAAQIDARRELPFGEVLDEWSTKGIALEATLNDAPPEMAALLIGDCASHGFDVRGALGNRDGRERAATTVSVHLYAEGLIGRIEPSGLAPLRIESTEGPTWGAEADAATATVRASSFELLRAITGRRCADQVRSLQWSGDPEPYLAVFATYPMRDDPLQE